MARPPRGSLGWTIPLLLLVFAGPSRALESCSDVSCPSRERLARLEASGDFGAGYDASRAGSTIGEPAGGSLGKGGLSRLGRPAPAAAGARLAPASPGAGGKREPGGLWAFAVRKKWDILGGLFGGLVGLLAGGGLLGLGVALAAGFLFRYAAPKLAERLRR
ncbi:MAG: hypothetical protein HY554_18115 [Elusimicrobia bacterium]|nr:hypothetical protein [Elusimicrobiota bacterium]